MKKDIIQSFIANPFPLWKLTATEMLLQNKVIDNYHTSQFVSNHPKEIFYQKIPIYQNGNAIINIELPTSDLADFYAEQGLDPLPENILMEYSATQKINEAFGLIKLIPQAHAMICDLVKSIQILRQDDPEMDSSFSHPKIPFTIFISVCQDLSDISNLRVAESILHESMHLKLTLIENEVPLIIDHPDGLYFSPWRDEKRPARGVLHGLFVFRAILDFYSAIRDKNYFHHENEFLEWRIDGVKSEIEQLKEFHLCPDLTEDGAILAKNLLPWN